METVILISKDALRFVHTSISDNASCWSWFVFDMCIFSHVIDVGYKSYLFVVFCLPFLLYWFQEHEKCKMINRGSQFWLVDLASTGHASITLGGWIECDVIYQLIYYIFEIWDNSLTNRFLINKLILLLFNVEVGVWVSLPCTATYKSACVWRNMVFV